jgi:hypothetical protein
VVRLEETASEHGAVTLEGDHPGPDGTTVHVVNSIAISDDGIREEWTVSGASAEELRWRWTYSRN